jgi:Flp pilus assembly protein TadG
MPGGSRIHGRRSGAALVMFSLMLCTVILPMVGLAIDGSICYLIKAKLSSAVDGAAIAAAASLNAGNSFDSQKAAATLAAQQFLTANFPSAYWSSTTPVFEVEQAGVTPGLMTPAVYTDPGNPQRRMVDMQVAVDVPLVFLRVIGWNTATVRVFAEAARRDVRLVLTLDKSGSMSGSIALVKAAAQYFVSLFAEGRDQLGLVVYGTTAIVAFPPRNFSAPTGGTGPAANFKTASPNMDTTIGYIASYGGTGMAEALWYSYLELQKNPLPGALNAIVLFTDGMPTATTLYTNQGATAATGLNVMKTTSTCTNRTSLPSDAITKKIIGGFTMTGVDPTVYYSGSSAMGAVQRMQYFQRGASNPDIQAWLSTSSEPYLPTTPAGTYAAGCSALGSGGSPSGDLINLPTQDAYGNTTNLASVSYARYYASGSGTSVDSNKRMYLASWSAVDSAAINIRNDATLKPVIYTIGLDGNCSTLPCVDQNLMKRLSNDRTGATYDATHASQAGKYYYVQQVSQLAPAFYSVASEILRLAM